MRTEHAKGECQTHVCPCETDDGCGCDCVSDYVDCVCPSAPRPFTDEEVAAYRKQPCNGMPACPCERKDCLHAS